MDSKGRQIGRGGESSSHSYLTQGRSTSDLERVPSPRPKTAAPQNRGASKAVADVPWCRAGSRCRTSRNGSSAIVGRDVAATGSKCIRLRAQESVLQVLGKAQRVSLCLRRWRPRHCWGVHVGSRWHQREALRGGRASDGLHGRWRMKTNESRWREPGAQLINSRWPPQGPVSRSSTTAVSWRPYTYA